jgi:hypothetical protein
MRAAALLGLLTLGAASSCGGTRACKGGTVLVTIQLGDLARAATNVQVDADVDNDHLSGIYAFQTTGSGTVEIDFPSGYPEGKQVSVRVTALKGAAKIVSARTVFTASAGCTAVPITVGSGDDGGMSCDPGTDNHCATDLKSLLTCKNDGAGFDTTACANGCTQTGGPAHCRGIEPSGAIDPSDYAAATAATTLSADTVFDTDSGAVTGGLVRAAGTMPDGGVTFRSVPQPGSTVKVAVWGFQSLTLMSGATVRFTGKSPAALVAAGDLMLSGNLDLQGDCTATPTAGGGAGGSFDVNNGDGLGTRGGRSGSGNPDATSGGGGGGAGDTGARGGNGGGGSTGGAGGIAFGDLNAEPLLLTGGSGGGSGGGGLPSGKGGNGGGALQLTSNGTITVAGTINAGGCGGRGGGAKSGGGGGGAGGALLFEAATIKLTAMAILAVNGGGGGGGDTGDAAGNGSASTSFAAGGAGKSNGSTGGTGGGQGRPAGAQGTDGKNNGGGGGGAAGRIALKTLTGTITDEGAILSPAATDKNSANQAVTTFTRAAFQ